jgi:hypothetical protein
MSARGRKKAATGAIHQAPGPTKQQVALERTKAQASGQRAETIVAFFRTAVRWGAVAYIVHEGRLAIDVLAGKTTDANLRATLDWIFTAHADRWVAMAVASIMSGLYARERSLRKKVTKAQGNTIAELERLIDPDRSGSRLKLTGEPRKRDLDGS